MSVEIRIALLVGLFAAGLLLRRLRLLQPAHAGRMLRLVITVGLPALFLADVSRIALDLHLMALPASSLIIMLVTLAASLAVGRAMGLPPTEQGAMTLCGVSLNNGFLFPFVIAAWGPAAFAQLALFDFGHIIGQSTFVAALAAWYGGHRAGVAAMLRKALAFPPLWAVLAALAINLAGLALPGWMTLTLGTVGRLILLLVIVALGVLFDARLILDRRVLATLALRLGLGVLLGVLLVWVFGLTGQARAVLLLGAAAPIGFTAVVFADREHLHRELAASAASLSVLLGLVYVPLALWLLPTT
jgi:predicted permease